MLMRYIFYASYAPPLDESNGRPDHILRQGCHQLELSLDFSSRQCKFPSLDAWWNLKLRITCVKISGYPFISVHYVACHDFPPCCGCGTNHLAIYRWYGSLQFGQACLSCQKTHMGNKQQKVQRCDMFPKAGGNNCLVDDKDRDSSVGSRVSIPHNLGRANREQNWSFPQVLG